ncbi:MAG: hypothetical protein HRU20_29405 [Pseudomonadales bacterium]|nr:hypothetical protein [Pseudomonadales bacterium]
MITYLYWITTAFIALSLLIFFVKNGAIKLGLFTFVFVVLMSWAAYFFHFEQMFVKRFGGVMNVQLDDDEIHLGSTWKDDNLWIESYNPKTGTCHFREFSKGNLLQGRVNMKNCKPLMHSNFENTVIAKPIKTAKPVALPRQEVRSTPQLKDQTSAPKNRPITLDDMPLNP